MKKQIPFPNVEDTQLDCEIGQILNREFPLPENVEKAKGQAFASILESGRREKQETANKIGEKAKRKQRKHGQGRWIWKGFAGAAAAAAVFSGVCIVNPAFAAQIPLVGNVFEELGESLGFSGDYSKFAKPLEEPKAGSSAVAENSETGITVSGSAQAGDENGAESNTAQAGEGLYTQTHNGMTVTLSEVYCNDTALYVSMILHTEDEFPETLLDDTTDTPFIDLMGSTMSFSDAGHKLMSDQMGNSLDGKMIDEHTFAGVVRFDLSHAAIIDEEGYYEAYYDFIEGLGISSEEYENSPKEASDKIAEILGVEWLSDQAIEDAGGPVWTDYKEEVQLPESFTANFTIPQIVGTKPDSKLPEMPQDIRAEYEQAMKDNGLGLSDEDYEGFTEEQKEVEHQLFTAMWNNYSERYPETDQYPNQYENWWVDGPWEFTFDVIKDSSQTIVKEINDVDENGLGLVSVTKTPFEICVKDGENVDYFTVVLDADGNIMSYGKFGGFANTLAVSDSDISKIDIYICDYTEYMDELKGYYYSDDYEEKKVEKTFKQLLDERALYHKEISFDE